MLEFLNPNYLIPAFGFLGIFCILMMESGLLIGAFLPGDSLLFIAGVFASEGKFSLSLLILICFLGTFTGDQLGYFLGRKYGPKLFSDRNSFFFNKKHLEKIESFFERYGRKAIIIARFIPIIRTGAPSAAGVAKMNYGKYLLYDSIGAIVWTLVFTLLGFFAGKVFKEKVHILGYTIFVVIGITILLSIIQAIRAKRKK